jgi:hypothetical protein
MEINISNGCSLKPAAIQKAYLFLTKIIFLRRKEYDLNLKKNKGAGRHLYLTNLKPNTNLNLIVESAGRRI